MASEPSKGGMLDQRGGTAAETPGPVAEEPFQEDTEAWAELPAFKPIGARLPPGGGSPRTGPARQGTATILAINSSKAPVAPHPLPRPVQADEPAPASGGRAFQPLLLAAVFAMGVAAGVGGAYLLPAGLPHGKDDILALQKTIFGGGSRDGGATLSSSGNGSTATSAVPAAPEVAKQSDLAKLPNGADPRATLVARAKRQIGERKLDRPPGDNALETYRLMAARGADDPAAQGVAAQLKAALSRRIDEAVAARRWDDAESGLESFATLQSLRPSTAGASAGPRPLASSAQPPSASIPAPVSGALPDDRAAAAITPSLARPPMRDAPSPETAAFAMARATEAMAQRDIIAARRFYELAFSGGAPEAATGVGSTYDPIFLRESGVAGMKGDANAAKRWYEKAIVAGDDRARPRLQKLLDASDAAH